MEYSKFIKEGLIYSLKQVIRHIKNFGINYPNQIYLKIDTANSLNVIPAFLKQKYPQTMDLVLENNNYSNLEINENYFDIVLFFDEGKDISLRIYFEMIHSVEDPEANFLLQFVVEKKKSDLIYIDDFLN